MRIILLGPPGAGWWGTGRLMAREKVTALDVARAAGAPIILETPSEGLADDVAYLKEALL
mgnify:CR=1 FL=1